jgi:Tfp pilus assembly protein PilO
MEDNQPKPENTEKTKPEMYVNDYGATRDAAVVVEEADRTVLLTENETVIIPKETVIDLPPKNRERKVYAGMWGQTELITVGVALLSVLTTVLLFVFLVLPRQRELDNNRAKRDELAKQWETAQRSYGSITTTEERVAELASSVGSFEARLPNETIGKTALYQRINGLIAAYGLVNTAGPLYAPLAMNDQNRGQQTEAEKGRSKFVSIFPGVYVTMTVDGSYQNIRRFINEIERSEQFVVVSAVELEPSENKDKLDNTQPPTQPQQPTGQTQATNYESANPNLRLNPNAPNQFQNAGQTTGQTSEKVDRGKMRGETVTLRLEMAAYFRRFNYAPQPVRTSVAPSAQ